MGSVQPRLGIFDSSFKDKIGSLHDGCRLPTCVFIHKLNITSVRFLRYAKGKASFPFVKKIGKIKSLSFSFRGCNFQENHI